MFLFYSWKFNTQRSNWDNYWSKPSSIHGDSFSLLQGKQMDLDYEETKSS